MYEIIIIICIIIILSIKILGFKNNEHYDNKLNKPILNIGYEWYRLGDLVSGHIRRESQNVLDVKNSLRERNILNLYQTKFKGSFVYRYIKKTQYLPENKKDNNYKIVNEIINEMINYKINGKHNYKLPNKNDIVIHLRVGDSLNSNKNICSGAYCTKLKTIEKISKLFKFKQLVFVYGSHISVEYKNKNKIRLTNIYLDKIKLILNKNGNKYIFIHNNNPDTDFIFMCKSKYFVQSGGGFSKLIGNIVKLNNGNIYTEKSIAKL
jgi:hypothetical protein